jgi:hypothetical protein
MYAYRVSVVQELKPRDLVKRLCYCQWILDNVSKGFIDPFLFISTDEAWFHLSGYVNSQNTRHWATHNPHESRQKPLHDLKIGVWCAVSFINTDVYLRIYEEFAAHSTPEEILYAYFQHDGATCHTSDRSLARIHSDFTELRAISKGLWPPRSTDPLPCDFYLWGRHKGKVYHNNPRTLEELKQNIQQEIAHNFSRRIEVCFSQHQLRWLSDFSKSDNHVESSGELLL